MKLPFVKRSQFDWVLAELSRALEENRQLKQSLNFHIAKAMGLRRRIDECDAEFLRLVGMKSE